MKRGASLHLLSLGIPFFFLFFFFFFFRTALSFDFSRNPASLSQQPASVWICPSIMQRGRELFDFADLLRNRRVPFVA